MESLFGGGAVGGGSLFATSSAFRQAVPAVAHLPALPPHARRPAPARSRAADEDSDDERLQRRQQRRSEAEKEVAAGAPSRRAARRADAVEVEPAEAPLPKKRKRSERPPTEAEALPHPPPDPVAEEEKAQRTVFVGNLPSATTKKRLRQLFSSCGAVLSARIRSAAVDPEAKLPRRAALLTGALNAARAAVNGYVVFKSAESVASALALNMSLQDGRHLRVDALRPAHASRHAPTNQLDPRRSVYLGNLHYEVDEEELIRLFAPCGAIEALRIPRDRDSGMGKGFGYVCFVDAGSIKAALGLAGEVVRGRPLRCARASAQRAAVSAASKVAHAQAAAAVAAAPGKADVKVARWKTRELAAVAAGGTVAVKVPLEAFAAAQPRGPAPWEGVHAAAQAAPPVAGGAPGAGKPSKVRTKPRWRDLGRELGGVPLATLPVPVAPRPKPANAPVKRKAGAKLGVGKDGGTKRVSSRKRPAVAARKAALERKKKSGS